MSWKSLRPIFNRLPSAYRDDNDGANASNYLTAFWDELAVEIRTKVSGFYDTYLDPASAPEDWLDWIAQLCGYTEEFWSPAWDARIKRQLIADSYKRIWVERGTQAGIDYWFDTFELDTYNPVDPSKTVYLIDYFKAGETSAPYTVGGEAYRWYLRLNESEKRGNPTWKQAAQIAGINSPVWSETSLGFRYFLAGRSAVGDAIFYFTWEQTLAAATLYLANNPHECLAVQEWLLTTLGISADATEIPVFRAGVSAIAATVYPENNIFIKVDPSVSLFGSAELTRAQTIADIYCGENTTTICFDRFYVGQSRCDQPIFTDAETERTVTVTTDIDGIPTPTYVDPDLIYDSRAVFEALAIWLNNGRSPSECLALFQYVLDTLPIAARAVEIGDFACGITPVPAPASGDVLAIRFENDANWHTDPAWETAENITEWLCRYGHTEGVGYDTFYVGVSSVENPIFESASPRTEYERTVSLTGTTPNYTEPSNTATYANRDVYDLMSAWESQQPLGCLGVVQWLVDNFSLPATIEQTPVFRVGDTIPAWVADQPSLYVIANDTVTRGDSDWQELERVASLGCRTGYRISFDSFDAGITLVGDPVFDSDAPTRTVTVDETPVPTYSEPDIQYADRAAYEAAQVYLDNNDIGAVDEFAELLQSVFDSLAIALTARNISDYVYLEFAYTGSDLSSTNDWQDADRIANRLSWQSAIVGYDKFYAGVSSVDKPLLEQV